MSKGLTFILLLHCGISLALAASGVLHLFAAGPFKAIGAALAALIVVFGSFRFLLPINARSYRHKEDAILVSLSFACLANYATILLEAGISRGSGLGNGWLVPGAGLGLLVGLAVWGYWQYILYLRTKVERQHLAAVTEAARLLELDRAKDAEDKLKESLLALEVAFGTEHLLTAQAASDLANLYVTISERARAGRMMLRALDVRRKLYGEDDLRVSSAVLEWVNVDDNLDPVKASEEMHKAVLNLERQLGAYAPQVAIAYERLGRLHYQQGQLADAETALRRAFSILKKSDQDHSEDIHRVGTGLANCYLAMDRTEDVEATLKEIAADTQKLPPSYQLESMILRLAVHSSREDQAAASEVAWEALQLMRQELGPEHERLKEVWSNCLERLTSPFMDPAASAAYNAVATGDSFTLRAPLQAHPEWVQVRDALGWTMLQWACFFGHERIVESLLSAGASLEDTDTEWPPFHIACRWSHRRLIASLATKVSSVDQIAQGGWHALHRCAQNGDDRTLDVLASRDLKFDVINARGDTPLMIACRRGFYLFVVALVSRGSDVNEINPESGRSPIHEAAYIGHRAIIECLILNGANSEVRDRANQTPLDLALQAEHEPVIKQLQSYAKGLKV